MRAVGCLLNSHGEWVVGYFLSIPTGNLLKYYKSLPCKWTSASQLSDLRTCFKNSETTKYYDHTFRIWLPVLLEFVQRDFRARLYNSTVPAFAPLAFCPVWGKANNTGMEWAGDIQEIILVARFQDSLKQKCTAFWVSGATLTSVEAGLLPSPSWLSRISLCPFEACCMVLDPAQNESMSH